MDLNYVNFLRCEIENDLIGNQFFGWNYCNNFEFMKDGIPRKVMVSPFFISSSDNRNPVIYTVFKQINSPDSFEFSDFDVDYDITGDVNNDKKTYMKVVEDVLRIAELAHFHEG